MYNLAEQSLFLRLDSASLEPGTQAGGAGTDHKTGSRDPPGWKGPQETPDPTSFPKQGQLAGAHSAEMISSSPSSTACTNSVATVPKM